MHCSLEASAPVRSRDDRRLGELPSAREHLRLAPHLEVYFPLLALVRFPRCFLWAARTALDGLGSDSGPKYSVLR